MMTHNNQKYSKVTYQYATFIEYFRVLFSSLLIDFTFFTESSLSLPARSPYEYSKDNVLFNV